MTTFSLGSIWEDTTGFLRREASLLIPVGLATFGVAQLLLELGLSGKPVDPAAVKSLPPQALLALPAALLLLFGNLAVSRIVLMPGRTIGESLVEALRCVPRALASMLLLIGIVMGIALMVVIGATLGAMTFQVDARGVSAEIVYLLFVPMFIIGIRMLLLIPVLAIEGLGPIATIRRSWALSREHFLRFLAVTALVLLLTMILAMIQMFVIGSLFQLLALAIGDAELITLLQGLINAGLEALLSVGVATFVALIYRQVAAA